MSYLFKGWCINRHHITNHFYENDIPYKFHLDQTHHVATEFKYSLLTGVNDWIIIEALCYSHDLIPDARTNYNDILIEASKYYESVKAKAIAEGTRALTEDVRGRNRDERNTSEMYGDIRNHPDRIYTKLCDRIANVRFGILTGSSMPSKYRKELDRFERELRHADDYKEMWEHLELILWSPEEVYNSIKKQP